MEGTLRGRPFSLGTPGDCKRQLCKRTSLSIGALLGNPEGDSETQMQEGSGNGVSPSVGALQGNLEGCSFTGDPEGYVKEGYGDGHLYPYRHH